MTSTASSIISRRISTVGQRSPSTCSFSASPVPTPKKNRPGIMAADVAAAWARIAGWIRMIGQVTPMPRRSRSVVAAMAPTTFQTKGLWPCALIHGW
jgi:hypothetical protein